MPLLLPLVVLAAAAPATASPAEELRHDNRGRPLIGVAVNGQGPFDMVVDTAAQTSLIVESLARELRLPPAGQTLDIVGATGTGEAQVYKVKRFANVLFDRRDDTLVALPNAGSTSARGIVGMDLLADRKLVFDRTAGSLSAVPSSAPSPGYVAVKGRATDVLSLVVPVTLNGVTMQALVDTGAAVTIASPAALRALGWKDDDPRLKQGGTISGATANGQAVRVASIDRLTVGPAALSNVRMIFPGSGALDGSDPAGEATLILGSDILNMLDAFAVDLRRGELQLRVPGATRPR